MTEYISRESAAKALMTHRGLTPIARLEAATTVCHVPAADVVEVVRCKDCELWSSCLSKQEKQVLIDTNTDGVCEYWMSDGLMPNDFCSYGKRKEGQL